MDVTVTNAIIEAGFGTSFLQSFTTPNIVSFIAGCLLALPFCFLAAKLIRRVKFSFSMTVVPGIFWCFAYICLNANALIKFFIFDFNSHESDTFYKMRFLYSEFAFLAEICYFRYLIKILELFEVKGTNVMNFIAFFIHYLYSVLIIFRIILSYIDVHGIFQKFLNAFLGHYETFQEYFEYVFNSFCFLILSLCFIFSQVRDFIPFVLRKYMKYCIFAFALTQFTAQITQRIVFNKFFELLSTKSSMYRYVYNAIWLFYRYTDFLVILSIVWLLSIDDFATKPKEPKTEEIMNVILV